MVFVSLNDFRCVQLFIRVLVELTVLLEDKRRPLILFGDNVLRHLEDKNAIVEEARENIWCVLSLWQYTIAENRNLFAVKYLHRSLEAQG